MVTYGLSHNRCGKFLLFIFCCSAFCGLGLTFHPGPENRTPRSWNSIAAGLTLLILVPLLRPYMTRAESFSSFYDEPVGMYIVGIYSPFPTYKAPSTSLEMWSVPSVSGIDSVIIAVYRLSPILRFPRLGTVNRVTLKFRADRLLLGALTVSTSDRTNCTTSR